jgi:phosphoribosylformylglycinamidine cyclo-ligase
MPDNTPAMTYAASGVNYDALDAFKRACQKRASATANNAQHLGVEPVEESRGESVYVVKQGSEYFGHVEEGLGTKNLVADAMRSLTQKTYYDQIAQDTVAMIANDMITLGILPVTLAMHLAVGDSAWFNDQKRLEDLVNGWGASCDAARCIWSGGETPALKGIIMPEAALLSGSAFGKAKEGHVISATTIQEGDAIVIVESSGIHANGLTLARSIADRLPDGYATKLSDGRMYGEALLDPTHLYVGLVEDCLDQGVAIHYTVNITGHGWRKLMRAPQSFSYVIGDIPKPQPVFDFIQEHGPVDDREAYGNFNMGAGFALYVPASHASKILSIATGLGLRALVAGHIEKSSTKKVVIKPKNLEYMSDTLAVR